METKTVFINCKNSTIPVCFSCVKYKGAGWLHTRGHWGSFLPEDDESHMVDSGNTRDLEHTIEFFHNKNKIRFSFCFS